MRLKEGKCYSRKNYL